MGTTSEWMWVAVSAIFWGGWMLLFASRKNGLSLLSVLALTPASLWFGLVLTFHSRAFHWPLILLTGASLVGAAVLGKMSGRKGLSSE